MINKRPFVDENCCEVASKHPRHCANELADIVSPKNASQECVPDDEGDEKTIKCPFEGRFSSDLIADVSTESENGGSSSIPHYLWVNSSIIDADVSTSHMSLFPEYFEHTDHLRVLLKPDDICASAVDHPPQKLVPIGPEHQAYVPEWDQRGSRSSDHQDELVQGSRVGFAEDDIKKMGTCVISMPKPEASLDCWSEEGLIRYDHRCPDSGSIRCVRQHVVEAREKLSENIGPKLFEDLGFCEMGEDFAKQWSEEEEHIFEEVVLANPVSLGKNFWDHLSIAFPSRTHKNLVSYYFNVFMLRKRAGQNRFDPMNVDSDNDEWQQSEHGVREDDDDDDDDDDSVVESPIDQDTPAYYEEEGHLEYCHENLGYTNGSDAYDEGADMVCSVGTVEEDGEAIDDASAAFIKDSPDNNCNSKIDPRSKVSNREDCDIQDDSCTSYDYQQDRTELCCPLDRGSLGTEARDCRVG